MRDDVLIEHIEKKCEVLKKAQLWPGQPRIRPEAWINNFELVDRGLAALLLDRFTFCNSQTTDSLLRASWEAISDGMQKGPKAPNSDQLVAALETAVFTAVEGETPSPTDSGNFMCRRARQILGVPDELIKTPTEALKCAKAGKTVVFLDDFVGSGDQFIKTFKREYLLRTSFKSVQGTDPFVCLYVTLITTDYGLDNINVDSPRVALCAAHTLTKKSTIGGLISDGVFLAEDVENFLAKYSVNLRPTEDYIATNPSYLKYGYKNRGLLLGFEHSIPDATLPIFWSPGINSWEPLIERT